MSWDHTKLFIFYTSWNSLLFFFSVYVVAQFYPWFKFSFLLFQTHYHVIIIHYHTQKQKKRKFEPRIKLNHNIYTTQFDSFTFNLGQRIKITQKNQILFCKSKEIIVTMPTSFHLNGNTTGFVLKLQSYRDKIFILV